MGADGYVSVCANCTTCLLLRSLLFITKLVSVMYCLRVDETSPRQIPMYILMSLANKLPCILVCMCVCVCVRSHVCVCVCVCVCVVISFLDTCLLRPLKRRGESESGNLSFLCRPRPPKETTSLNSSA